MLRDHLDKTGGSIHAIPEFSHSVMVDVMKAKLKGPELLECQVCDQQYLGSFYILVSIVHGKERCGGLVPVPCLLRRGRLNIQESCLCSCSNSLVIIFIKDHETNC